MDKKMTPCLRKEALEKIRDQLSGNDATTQSFRLLKAMQVLGGISTIEANRYLDILNPPARKLNLIQRGYIIPLVWVYEDSSCGKLHRVGKYIYMGETSYPLFDHLDDEVPE
tara:strand:- start:10389 stop:10724 length:336 start_codon:yes stop_codon:yes gene_type:complete